MSQHIKLLFSSILTITIFALSGCGSDGGSGSNNHTDSSTDNQSHPRFKWAKVSQSSNYSPSGDITTTTPKFTWPATPNAENYIIGHENTHDESQWTQYTIPANNANCDSSNQTCSYTPSFNFSKGDQKAWWVKAEVSGQWQAWSAANVFNIVTSGQTGRTNTLSPFGEIETTKPIYTWEARPNATKYRFGYDSTNARNAWKAYTTTAVAACQNTNKCTFQPKNIKLSVGDKKTWWVQAYVAGAWENWSESLSFTVIKDDDTGGPSIIKALSPQGKVSTTKPKLVWTNIAQASDYQIGYAIKNDANWYEFNLKGKSSFICSTSSCSYDFQENEKFKMGDQVSWWVRFDNKGTWSEWSNELKFSITVNDKTPQSIAFNTLANTTYKPLLTAVNTVQATATSGLPIDYTVNTANICTLTNNKVFAKISGICSITATQAGNNKFQVATPVTQSFTIAKAAQSYAGVTRTNGSATGAEIGDTIVLALVTDQSSHGTTLPVVFTPVTTDTCTLSNTVITAIKKGNCQIKVTRGGDNKYLSYATDFNIAIKASKVIPLKIISKSVTAVSQNSASIQWVLNEIATGQVEYGETSAYGSLSNKNNTLSTSQSQTLAGLKADTTYHYRVISENSGGTIVMSNDSTFKTAKTTPPNNSLIRILPLGDSITHGAGYNFANPDHSSYRDELYELLKGAQLNIEYVGTDASTYTQSNGNTIELKHEGHPSWRADEINANLTSWLTSYGVSVDVALVHAGTNDILQTQNDAQTRSEVESIIDKLQASNANISILIAKIIPIQNPDTSLGFNTLLTDAWATAQSTSTSIVKVVDHHSGFTPNYLSNDLIHPNVAGEAKMAQTWFNAITNTPANPTDPTLPIQDATLTLWLDASDSNADGKMDTTMANTSATNWSWKDKSGKSNDVVTVANSLPPTQLANGLKGKPVFDFETTGLVTPDADQITQNTSYTKFVVFKYNETTTANNLISSHTTALWGGHTQQMHVWHSFENYLNPKTPAQGLSLADSSVGTDKFHIASTRYGQPAGLSNVLNLNSILQNSNQLAKPFGSSVTFIGSIADNYYLDGEIAEAIIYDRALSDTEIATVESYLRAKWF